MPSSINPLLVDLEELKKVFGSKNKKLYRDIVEAGEIDDEDTDPDDYEEDEQDEDEDDDFDPDDLEELPSSKEALKHIITGAPWARGIGSKYGYMFMEICQHLGERLEADNWCETRADYVIEFDKVLKKLNVPDSICMSNIVFGGGPFPLPPRSDAPEFGTLTTQMAAEGAKALAAVDRTALQAAAKGVKISRGVVEAEFVIASFEELQKWFETCVEKKKDLIAFYY